MHDVMKYFLFIVAALNALSLSGCKQNVTERNNSATAQQDVCMSSLQKSLKDVQSALDKIVLDTEIILSNESCNDSRQSPYFKKNGGAYADYYHIGETQFYLRKGVTINKDIKDIECRTGRLTQMFENNKKRFPSLGWQYVVDYKYRTMRAYPWFDSETILGHDTDWTSYGFFSKSRDLPPNLISCKNSGYDIAGIGLIITCFSKIESTNGNEWGIAGVDLPVDNYFEDTLSCISSASSDVIKMVTDKNRQVLLRPKNIKSSSITLQDNNLIIDNKSHTILEVFSDQLLGWQLVVAK